MFCDAKFAKVNTKNMLLYYAANEEEFENMKNVANIEECLKIVTLARVRTEVHIVTSIIESLGCFSIAWR